jgi:CRISPR-associated protein Csm2
MAIVLWQDRAKRVIDPQLFSETAEELAKKINAEKTVKINNPTQIRKFFDEVIRFQGMVQANPEQFHELLPYIKMLNAKAAYAAGRDLIGPQFKSFLSDALREVHDQKDFELFCSFFEAFFGFYKYYAEKEKDTGGYPQRLSGGQQQGRFDNQRREPQVFRKP